MLLFPHSSGTEGGTGPCTGMGTLGNTRLLLCCALWRLCLASDYDGECVPLGVKLLLVKVLGIWDLCKIPENLLFNEFTWENALIELCVGSC